VIKCDQKTVHTGIQLKVSGIKIIGLCWPSEGPDPDISEPIPKIVEYSGWEEESEVESEEAPRKKRRSSARLSIARPGFKETDPEAEPEAESEAGKAALRKKRKRKKSKHNKHKNALGWLKKLKEEDVKLLIHKHSF
jgi:hypothetical protein